MSAEHFVTDRVKIHLIRWKGQVLAQHWSWPQGHTRIDLARLLQDLHLAPDAQDEVRLCRLHHAQDGTGRVGFEHTCRLLRCSHNGRVLSPSELVWLQESDVLDIGLMRLQFGASLQALPPQALHESTDNAEGDGANDDALDLRKLADGPGMATGKLLTQRTADALDDLSMCAPFSDRTRQKPGGPTTQSPPHARDVLRPDALQMQPSDDPLQQWHARYLQRLQAPMTPLSEVDWHLDKSRHNHSKHDAMAELMTRAQDGPSLTGLLGQSEHISTVLAMLDDSQHDPFFSTPADIHVMHLFAPQGWQQADAAQVPALTRQDHHGMALDSAITLPDTPSKKPT